MSDWYCPACSIYIEPASVTNDERHELCGAALTSGPVDSPYRRALARVIELEAALHSAYQDWLDDFPDDCPMEYDKWLALHVTCGKEMRAP